MGLAAMARLGKNVVVVNNPPGVAGLTATIPSSVKLLPVALVLQVASLLNSGVRDLRNIERSS